MKNLFKNLWARYWQPSATWARRVGDACLLLIPVLAAVSFNNPVFQDYKTFVYVGLVFIKFLTNFSKKEPAAGESDQNNI